MDLDWRSTKRSLTTVSDVEEAIFIFLLFVDAWQNLSCRRKDIVYVYEDSFLWT